jgi:hypothetical protein
MYNKVSDEVVAVVLVFLLMEKGKGEKKFLNASKVEPA